MNQQKDLRLNIRTTPEQRALIERAAALRRTTISAFMLDQACEAAERILAEQRHFELSPQQWNAFCSALDAAPKQIPALKRLFAKPSVFGGESREKTSKSRSKASGRKKARAS
ncbi:MAG TPA: DUF1778 domain-containing protein [Candidatus Obscuribacterales bacterium]